MPTKDAPARPPSTANGLSDDACVEQRCACGSLLARLVPGGVELKCRRCKRILVLPLDSVRGEGSGGAG